MFSNSYGIRMLLCSLVAAMPLFISCKKISLSPFKEVDLGDPPAVLVVGKEFNGTNNVAKAWADGKGVDLSDGNNDASANSASISGNDSYVAGNDAGPVFWKNGVENHLPSNSPYTVTNSMLVSGSRVLICGTDAFDNNGSSWNRAVYWDNGVETALDATDSNSAANAITLYNNEVYIAGTRGYNVVYWKNGTINYQTHEGYTGSHVYHITSLAVSNGKVYEVGWINAAGAVFPQLAEWNDGVFNQVTRQFGTNWCVLNSVCSSGNSIYMAGMTDTSTSRLYYNAAYWKDGQQFLLPNSAKNSFATSICVKGNDIYVAGYEYNDNGPKYAVYWKNGVEVKLTDGSRDAYAYAIAVR
jgi:hypothetical protein